MAFAVVNTTNLYNANLEGLTKTDLIRRGLASGGFQEDAANKALGGPQYVVNATTTAADALSVYLSLAVTLTRSVPNPLGSPSLNDQILLAGPDVISAGLERVIRVEGTQTTAGVKTYFKAVGVFRNAATPTVQTDFTVVEGAYQGASTLAGTTFAAGTINLVLTGIAATNIAWNLKVFLDDPR